MSGSELLFLGAVVTADSVIEQGALVVQTQSAGGKILYAGSFQNLPNEYQSLPNQSLPGTKFLLPGLIDLHCHGGAGVSFPDCDSLTDIERGASEHLRHGTTTLVASLVTATLDELEQKAALLAEAVDAGYIHAFHFEGPFISRARCGAQDPQKIQELNPLNAKRLVRAAREKAFSITIAPEQVCTPQGLQGLQILVEGKILPSWGHTSASLTQTRQAVASGMELLSDNFQCFTESENASNSQDSRKPQTAKDSRDSRDGQNTQNPQNSQNSKDQKNSPEFRDLQDSRTSTSENFENLISARTATVTHMFNGMEPLHHRKPGAIPEFLAAAKRGQLLVELICDGIHVDLELIASMVELLGRHSIVFVTDAIAAAGMPEGEYVLGGQKVQVKGQLAYLCEDNCLAGGTSHLLEQVHLATSVGISLPDACFMASASPAKALGLSDRGQLHAGLRADFLAVDKDFQPLGIWRQGARI